MSKSAQWIVGLNAVASALEHDAEHVREVLLEAGAKEVVMFARRPIPMRVFRTLPSAIAWMDEITDLEATRAEVLAAAERLRSMA